MIIELFGPPCAGKTTFACCVAGRLRDRCPGVELVLSYRPSENPRWPADGAARSSMPAALQRLARPMIERLATVCDAAGAGEGDRTAELMRLLSSGGAVQSLRLRQYLVRLFGKWRAAERSAVVAVFDQAFVQVVCSSAQLTGRVDADLVARALNAMPEADLLVQLRASRQVLELRLAERRHRQSRIERLFDRQANDESVWVYDRISELLLARGRSVVIINSADHRSFLDGIDRVEAMVIRRQGATIAQNRRRLGGG